MLFLLVVFCVIFGEQDIEAMVDTKPRLFAAWFGKEEKQLSNQFLPASLQVLEHTASQVNSSWNEENGNTKGDRVRFFKDEVQPIPGILRLVVLRNSLLLEAKAAQLDNYDGFTPEVTSQLQATSQLPLPEQLAKVIERTIECGELKQSIEETRGQKISLLAYELVDELRDKNTQLASSLNQFESLKYAY